MSRFARRARWLQELFTPSVRPTTSYPDSYSDDISLTQPYDGGGWGMQDPEETIFQVTSVVAAVATTLLFATPLDSIARLIAVSVNANLGVVPTFSHLQIRSPGVGFTCACAPSPVLVAGELVAYVPTLKILMPGYELLGRYIGGDAATQLIYRIAVTTLPLGTSPVL